MWDNVITKCALWLFLIFVLPICKIFYLISHFDKCWPHKPGLISSSAANVILKRTPVRLLAECVKHS